MKTDTDACGAGHPASRTTSTGMPMAQLFDSLRQGNERAVSQAIEELTTRLTSWARSELRRRGIGSRADLQEESLANSTMVTALQRVLQKAKDAEHFEAIVRTVLKHKLLDRLKRGGSLGPVRAFADFREETEAALIEHSAFGPRSEADADAREEFAKFEEFRAALSGPDGLDATQWRILDDHLVRDRSLGDIAADLGINREAAKQRYATVRRRALAAVFSEVCRQLSPPAKALAHEIFISRADVDAIGPSLGISHEDMAFLVLDEILPAITSKFGCRGTQVVAGLLGAQS